jgi:hypothetical protein
VLAGRLPAPAAGGEGEERGWNKGDERDAHG